MAIQQAHLLELKNQQAKIHINNLIILFILLNAFFALYSIHHHIHLLYTFLINHALLLLLLRLFFQLLLIAAFLLLRMLYNIKYQQLDL